MKRTLCALSALLGALSVARLTNVDAGGDGGRCSPAAAGLRAFVGARRGGAGSGEVFAAAVYASWCWMG